MVRAIEHDKSEISVAPLATERWLGSRCWRPRFPVALQAQSLSRRPTRSRRGRPTSASGPGYVGPRCYPMSTLSRPSGSSPSVSAWRNSAARFTRRGRLMRLTVGRHRAIARHLHKTTLTLLLAIGSSPSSVPARCSTANASGNPRSASLAGICPALAHQRPVNAARQPIEPDDRCLDRIDDVQRISMILKI